MSFKRRDITNAQLEVFELARRIRDEASMAQSGWNNYLAASKTEYGMEAYDRLEWTEMINREGEDLLNHLEDTELELVEDPREITGLAVSPEDAYHAMRELEYVIQRGDLEQEKMYVEPLEMAQDDFRSFYQKVVSSPMYGDLERIKEIEENANRRNELQEDIHDSAEKLGFYSSMLEEVLQRADKSNIEAAESVMEKLMKDSYSHFMKGVGLLRDVREYRERNDIGKGSSFVSSEGLYTDHNVDRNPAADDVFAASLHREISNYIGLMPKMQKLHFDPDPVEEMDDSEILDEEGDLDIDPVDFFWEEE